jgi:hypothetical protein
MRVNPLINWMSYGDPVGTPMSEILTVWDSRPGPDGSILFKNKEKNSWPNNCLTSCTAPAPLGPRAAGITTGL